VGDAIDVTVLRVDPGERKIGLSRKKPHDSREARGESDAPPPASGRAETAPLKGGLGGRGPLFNLGGESASDPSGPDDLDD
jgi:small subunit ribosomal protein S1